MAWDQRVLSSLPPLLATQIRGCLRAPIDTWVSAQVHLTWPLQSLDTSPLSALQTDGHLARLEAWLRGRDHVDIDTSSTVPQNGLFDDFRKASR